MLRRFLLLWLFVVFAVIVLVLFGWERGRKQKHCTDGTHRQCCYRNDRELSNSPCWWRICNKQTTRRAEICFFISWLTITSNSRSAYLFLVARTRDQVLSFLNRCPIFPTGLLSRESIFIAGTMSKRTQLWWRYLGRSWSLIVWWHYWPVWLCYPHQLHPLSQSAVSSTDAGTASSMPSSGANLSRRLSTAVFLHR